VLLPVEEAADRPEEVVEVTDVVTQRLNDPGGFPGERSSLVRDAGGFLLHRHLLLQIGDSDARLRHLLE
jgi:hypothetical protein